MLSPSGFLDMSGLSFPELTDVSRVSSMASPASFNVPAADALVGTEELMMSNNDTSGYFGECIQDFL